MKDFAQTVEASLVGGLVVLRDLIDAAVAHADGDQVGVDALLQARLYEDMFPFWRQVHSACNVARRTVDRLAGETIDDPRKPEPTVEGLRGLLDETIAYVRAADAEAIEATASSEVTAKLAKQPVVLTGRSYLTNFALPNFLFHVVTAYNLLRHRGVPVGKHGYLRPLIDQGARAGDGDG